MVGVRLGVRVGVDVGVLVNVNVGVNVSVGVNVRVRVAVAVKVIVGGGVGFVDAQPAKTAMHSKNAQRVNRFILISPSHLSVIYFKTWCRITGCANVVKIFQG